MDGDLTSQSHSDTVPPMTESEMFARLGELRDTMQTLQREADAAKDEHDRFQVAVFQYMKDRGTTSYGTEDETWVRKATTYGSITNREAFVKWAEEQGLLDEFTQRKEVGKRINELVRQMLGDGQDLPPGVDFYEREYISRTNK